MKKSKVEIIKQPTGKAKCPICNELIKIDEVCVRISINSRANPFFHAKCLGEVAVEAISAKLGVNLPVKK